MSDVGCHGGNVDPNITKLHGIFAASSGLFFLLLLLRDPLCLDRHASFPNSHITKWWVQRLKPPSPIRRIANHV